MDSKPLKSIDLPPCRFTPAAVARAPRFTLWSVFNVALLVLALLPIGDGPSASAQELGQQPPIQSIRAAGIADDAAEEASSNLKVTAFLFLDKNSNRVILPGMTYEQWDQLDSESGTTSQLVVFDPIKINGSVSGSRAELDVELRVTVSPTGGQLISIPLEMRNYRLLQPAELTSSPPASNRELQLIDAGKDGFELKVRSQRRRTIRVKLRVSALVESGPPQMLKFQLPEVPTIIGVEMDAADLTGKLVGGAEVPIKENKLKDGRTQFKFESGGGNFLFQWRPNETKVESAPLMEVESRVDVNWGSPQDQPIVSVEMDLRYLRERRSAADTFDLVLPPGAVLLDTPTLSPSKQVVGEKDTDDPNRKTITIPDAERSQRISMRFDLQFPNDNASQSKPLLFKCPTIVGAIRQKGDITFRGSSDYQLRWRRGNWVRRSLRSADELDSDDRTYQFHFDRGEFDLPVWLAASQRQLRITSESNVSVNDAIALLEMDIRFAGQASDSRTLQIDTAGWAILSVTDAETEEALPWSPSETLSIDVNTGADQPTPIKVIAEKRLFPIDADPQTISSGGDTQEPIAFSLPKIIKTDDQVTIANQYVTLEGTGRSTLVVDLSKSIGIDRSPLAASLDEPKISGKRFRLTASDRNTLVVASIVEQPIQVTLASETQIQLLGDTLMTTVDWTIQPQVDLIGALPVRVPATRTAATIGQADAGRASVRGSLGADVASSAERSDDASVSNDEQWTVTVNGEAARLTRLSGERYQLYSDLLGKGEVTVRWRRQESLDRRRVAAEVASVGLPGPAFPDVTIVGDVLVSLAGDSKTSLLSANSPARSELSFQSLPDQVRLRMSPKTTLQDDLSIRKAVLRSAIGDSTRHEQLIALVQGGDALELGLPSDVSDVEYEAYVDSQRVPVSREGNRIRLALPGDKESHSVDLRIWTTEPVRGWMVDIKPTLQLPIRAGRVYWQIVTPRDSHVVWAAPTVGRAMDWRFGAWQLSREPILNDTKLTEWVDAKRAAEMPPGNRYLYIGSDIRSFHARTMTRSWLWFLVGGLVLGLAWLLTYVPLARNPLTVIAGAVLFTGLLAVAPDAAVLAGQFAMVALILVVVMHAVRVLNSNGDRLLQPSSAPKDQPSSPALAPTREYKENASPSATHSASASASEATSS